MSKRRKQSKPENGVEKTLDKQISQEDASDDFWGSMLAVLTEALFFSRWFLPTEAAVEGDTLWVSMLFLLLLGFWGLRLWRVQRLGICWNWLDTSVFLLSFGHVLSALVVIFSEGQKRAATNMLWEWVGIATTFFLIRQTFRDSDSRQSLLKVTLTISLVLAGFGIYQHYVEYPTLRNDFLEIEKEISETSPDDEQKWNQLQMKLAELGIPTDKKKRQQLAQRILYSSEPFGFFGLANSFATIAILGLLITIALSANPNSKVQNGSASIRLSFYAIAGILFFYCLLLTKSRTALVGTFAGIGLLIFILARSAFLQNKKLIRYTIIGFCVIGILVSVAITTGSFDFAVLTESSKSLTYRMEYWRGSLGVISEAPIFGVGPGQFRQTYLKYKLPESSESILDPHNLILDVWANGGLIALSGLILTVVFGFRYLSKTEVLESIPKTNFRQEIAIGLIAFGLAYLVPFAIGLGFDDRLIVLATIWFGLHYGWNLLFSEQVSSFVSKRFGMILFAGTSVHLLGAGGIAMPAITTIWLLGPALSDSSQRKVSAYTGISISVAALLGVMLLYYSSLSPVLNTKNQMQQALSAASESTRKIALRKASEDSFDPQPRLFQAQLAFGKWKSDPKDLGQFSEAIVLLHEARKKDPKNVEFFKSEGKWWLERFQETNSVDDAEKAQDALLRASKMSPTDVLLLVDLAISCNAAEKPELAAKISQNVLELNQTNQELGHVDKVLDENLVEKMSSLAGFDENSNDN